MRIKVLNKIKNYLSALSKINFKDEYGNYNKEILVTTMDTYPSVESHGLEDLKKEIEAMQ